MSGITLLGASARRKPSLLLHFNGANNSTAIVDSGPLNATLTAFGNARISTTQSKFGGSSLFVDGTGSYVYSDGVAPFSRMIATTTPWTMECWCYQTAAGSGPVIFGICARSSTANVLTSQPANLFIGTGGTAGNTTAFTGPTVPNNTWVHYACVSTGTSTKVFVDGVLAVSVAAVTPTTLATSVLGIGAEFDTANGGTPGNYFVGYIDEFRFTAGAALYTANFTPPAGPFLA